MKKCISFSALLPIAISLTGCMVGPRYQRPAAPVPPEFKESAAAAPAWKLGQPNDAALKGDWWTLYGDPQLNALESQVDTANQGLKISEANFRAARAAVGIARADQAPTIGISPNAGTLRDSANSPYFFKSLANNGSGNLVLPLDLNYEVDLWGRVRRQVAMARAEMQANAADLANARLSLHAELAMDYFALRSADAREKLLDDTIHAYQDAYDLTKQRVDGDLAEQSDVDQAEAQLHQAQVQRNDVEIQRSQLEHAIAILVGKPPAKFTLAPDPGAIHALAMPRGPVALPSALLERRPDIAIQERQMAAANEAIGIAKSAYYPSLSISAIAGMQSISPADWFTWPSRFWAVGGTLSETLFDAGRRHARTNQAAANYDAAVASYRQTVLQGFQQVEDTLTALRVLQTESENQQRATAASLRALKAFNERYEGGLELYLQVVVAQTTALGNQRNDIDITQRQLDASVLLIKALGGGWTTQQLPRS